MDIDLIGGSDQLHSEAPWCPKWLFDAVFGQDASRDNDPGGGILRSYLLVDATLFSQVAGPLSLEESHLPIRSLFQGEAEREYAASAPYILDLTLPDNWQSGAPLAYRAFASRYWGHQSGVVLRSRASLDQLRRHLRRFTRMKRSDTGDWVLFRFWDSRVAMTHFSALSGWPARQATWFNPSDCPPIEAIILEGERPEEGWLMFPSAPSQFPAPRPDNILSDYELAALENASRTKFIMRLVRGFQTLEREAEGSPIDTTSWRLFSIQALGRAEALGLTTQQAVARFAYLAASMGLGFVSDPRLSLVDRQVIALQNASDTERFTAGRRMEKDLAARITADGGASAIKARIELLAAYQATQGPADALRQVAPNVVASLNQEQLSGVIDRFYHRHTVFAGTNSVTRCKAACLMALYGVDWPADPRFSSILSELMKDVQERDFAEKGSV